MTGNKYFNEGTGTGSIRRPNQFVADKTEIMTTTGGNPVADNRNLIAGGPLL
ncbi:MAG TPA: hypothetical protein VNT99_03100 [Methylomirabilota bacterium]|nr:hypothetical protein [Methylomirabilota bacterium]